MRSTLPDPRSLAICAIEVSCPRIIRRLPTNHNSAHPQRYRPILSYWLRMRDGELPGPTLWREPFPLPRTPASSSTTRSPATLRFTPPTAMGRLRNSRACRHGGQAGPTWCSESSAARNSLPCSFTIGRKALLRFMRWTGTPISTCCDSTQVGPAVGMRSPRFEFPCPSTPGSCCIV
jgi:hypothetical protein